MRLALALVLPLAISSACASAVGALAPREALAPRPDPSLRSVEDGIVAYKSERYPEAAWCFAEIAAGRIPIGEEGDREKAAFWLAKSSIRLNNDPRAIALFAAIARDPSHPFYELTLPWLVHLRIRQPDDPRLDQAIGGYPLSILAHADFVEVVDDLRVAFAAHRLRVGDTKEAYALAAAVPPGTDAHREAQLLAGYASLRIGREAAAIGHFKVAAAAPERPQRRRRRAPPSDREAFDESIRARARAELARRGVAGPER